MGEIKTLKTDQSAEEFLKTIEPESKREDGLTLLELFKKATGQDAVMWGTSIVGFGQYHYKSERSSQEGDWPLVGFSPRKQNLTLYVIADNHDSSELLEKLGKHKTSRGCLYINKLADVDMAVLEKIIENCYSFMKKTTKTT